MDPLEETCRKARLRTGLLVHSRQATPRTKGRRSCARQICLPDKQRRLYNVRWCALGSADPENTRPNTPSPALAGYSFRVQSWSPFRMCFGNMTNASPLSGSTVFHHDTGRRRRHPWARRCAILVPGRLSELAFLPAQGRQALRL